MEQFNRGLADARKLLMPKEEAMKMQEIARKVKFEFFEFGILTKFRCFQRTDMKNS